ncbi:MAG: hypothetical protein CSA34_02785 [Desulfobulbus propionicus]|nr:MAG: hypothetical protein CSA34_02785 [Desulfobulbus propionicus]
MINVLDDLHKKTNYTFIIPDEWRTFQVNGKYTDIDLETFFHRVFKRVNFSLLIDEKERLVTVQLYGKKEGAFSQIGGGENVTDLDPELEIPRKELAERHKRQLEMFEKSKKDPEAIDPEFGVPYVELAKRHKKQLERFEKSKKDPEAIDPEFGVSYVELAKRHKKQLEMFKNGKKDLKNY